MEEYLVTFMTKEYLTDFLILGALTPKEAWSIVEKLDKVEQVLCVWKKELDG